MVDHKIPNLITVKAPAALAVDHCMSGLDVHADSMRTDVLWQSALITLVLFP